MDVHKTKSNAKYIYRKEMFHSIHVGVWGTLGNLRSGEVLGQQLETKDLSIRDFSP